MVTKTTAEEIPAMKENFAELFNEMFGEDKGLEGSVVKGTIVALSDDYVTVDVGLKSEGRIARREFGFNAEMKVGDQVDVYIDRYEDKDGMVVLSREKARREEEGHRCIGMAVSPQEKQILQLIRDDYFIAVGKVYRAALDAIEQ